MPVLGIDHFTVLTEDLDETCRFYGEVLGLVEGARPPFGVPGAWLYAGNRAVLHIAAMGSLPENRRGVLDHMAFQAEGLARTARLLEERGMNFTLGRQPGTGMPGSGRWQMFFTDLNGATVELDFDAGEPAPQESAAGA